ncbi:MAG: lycopene cyclase domain-containing protein [bacterium]|nr:lycopene cyclase domain-containing protein [bacterium]
MDLPIQYAYMVLGGVYFTLWVIFFVYRPDIRREMLVMSVMVTIVTLIVEPIFITDYWTPTLWNGWKVGFEDVLYGFATGGVASSLYQVFFRKYFVSSGVVSFRWSLAVSLYVVGFSVFFVVKYGLGFSTMVAALNGFSMIFMFMMLFRSDLLRLSFYNGLLCAALTLPMYLFVLALFPRFVMETWHVSNLSGLFLMGIPIEEFIWSFAFGLVSGPFYKCLTGLRLKTV